MFEERAYKFFPPVWKECACAHIYGKTIKHANMTFSNSSDTIKDITQRDQ